MTKQFLLNIANSHMSLSRPVMMWHAEWQERLVVWGLLAATPRNGKMEQYYKLQIISKKIISHVFVFLIVSDQLPDPTALILGKSPW
jgi:hypothetical protein